MTAALRASSASRSRPLPARAGVAMLLTLALSGCALWNRKPAPAAPTTPPRPPTFVAPAHLGLGRILSHDAAAGVALVELSPFVTIPAGLAGRPLIARDPETLAPTARLVASARRAGSVLGAYVVEGEPSPGDEVVLPPAP